jgi:hypothetical protein
MGIGGILISNSKFQEFQIFEIWNLEFEIKIPPNSFIKKDLTVCDP